MKTGNIPEKIVYIDHFRKTMFDRNFDDGQEIAPKFLARKSFVSDASNKKTIETGIKWAKATGYGGGYEEDKNGKIKHINYPPESKREVIQEEVENIPFSNVNIFALEHRDQGGRAYKVLVGERVFDLREDVLLDLLLNAKVENGKIEGEFIWAKVGSQMKMIRVGSALHKKMIESTNFGKTLADSKVDLVVGGLYESKTKKMVYIGKYPWVKTDYIDDPEAKKSTNYHTYWNTPKLKVITDMPAEHWFFEFPGYDEGKYIKMFETGKWLGMNTFHFKHQKSKPKAILIKIFDKVPSVHDFYQLAYQDEIRSGKGNFNYGFHPTDAKKECVFKPETDVSEWNTMGMTREKTQEMLVAINKELAEAHVLFRERAIEEQNKKKAKAISDQLEYIQRLNDKTKPKLQAMLGDQGKPMIGHDPTSLVKVKFTFKNDYEINEFKRIKYSNTSLWERGTWGEDYLILETTLSDIKSIRGQFNHYFDMVGLVEEFE